LSIFLFLVWWEECVKDWVFGVAVIVVFKQKIARKDNTATHKTQHLKLITSYVFEQNPPEDDSYKSKCMEQIM